METNDEGSSDSNNELPVLKLEGIGKTYRQGSGGLEILTNIQLDILKGEMVALLGPSGSGKSTLLQISGLLDSPTEGNIFLAGENLRSLSERKRTLVRREKIGFVYQFHHLLPEFTALENLVVPQMIKGVSRRQATVKAEEFLEKVGLKDRAQHRPARLSGGEQQRVAIARALINDPLLLLADEPTGNLDPATSDVIFSLLLSIVREKKVSCLIATHNTALSKKMT